MIRIRGHNIICIDTDAMNTVLPPHLRDALREIDELVHESPQQLPTALESVLLSLAGEGSGAPLSDWSEKLLMAEQKLREFYSVSLSRPDDATVLRGQLLLAEAQDLLTTVSRLYLADSVQKVRQYISSPVRE